MFSNSINEEYVKSLFIKLEVQNMSSRYFFYFKGENSRFFRINESKLRQVTFVEQSILYIRKKSEPEKKYNIQLSGNLKNDEKRVRRILNNEYGQDVDKYSIKNEGDEVTIESMVTKDDTDWLREVGLRRGLVGIFSSGTLKRGAIRGGSQKLLWYETDRSDVDYSLYEGDLSIKEFFSIDKMVSRKVGESIDGNLKKLKTLKKKKVELSPGKYRAYFCSSAVNEIISMFNWKGLQGKAFAEKRSVFMDLHTNRSFNKNFNLRENFNLNLSPSFNEDAQESSMIVNLIEKGKLISPLVNSVSEQKYGLKSNAANSSETLRSAEIVQGNREESDLVRSLKPGVYVSNLHYLNWSNPKNASITGMTRFGCYFIDEKGEMSPIHDMRFNMSLYDLFGDWLESFSNESKIFCDSNSYEERSVRGAKVPGMLSSINFTL